MGGGVVGLVLGLRLAQAGREVIIFDSAEIGANASGVAAGMLAPASEALELGGLSFDRLRRARDYWPELATSIGIELDRSGAVHVRESNANIDPVARMRTLGAVAELTDLPTWIAPGLGSGIWTPEDWRLEPASVLTALRQAFLAAGGRWIMRDMASASHVAELGDRTQVVVAMGWGAAACAELAPELSWLSPIKGQILRFDAGPRSGPVLRHGGLYLAPTATGLVVGATMEVGVSDLALDSGTLDTLQNAAAKIAPALATASRTASAGVRAATPDGWPLVGRASTGLWLSVGVRRNGWLLAPLMADVMHAHLDGRAHPNAELFATTRFRDV